MKVAPQTWLTGSMLLLLGVAGAAMHIALNAPMLGLGWSVPDTEPGLVVDAVAPDSPNRSALTPGTRVLTLATVTLDEAMLIDEPDQLFDWPRYNDFMARQSTLIRALGQGDVTAELADGRSATVRARPRRFTDLPFMFWFQILVGALGFLIGVGVLAFRREASAARHFGLAGLGMLIFTHAAAVYSTRELVMDGRLVQALSALNHFGALLFTAALVALLWNYPRRLQGLPVATASYLIAAIFWSGIALQWLPDMSWAHLVTLLLFSVSFVLAFFQWRATRSLPTERAALKWYLLSIYLGTGLFAAFILVPVALSVPPPAEQGLMFMVFLFMFGGIALGILRYRLFDLDRWWFRAWSWFLSGVAVILLDLALVSWLDVTQFGALALSLALLGWVYFPLRQLAWTRLLRRGVPVGRERVGQWLQTLATAQSEEDLARRLRQVLQQELRPLESTRVDQAMHDQAMHDQAMHAQAMHAQAVHTVSVSSDGQELRVPDLLDTQSCWVLRYPATGSRLFSAEDRDAAQALLDLGRHVKAALTERQQIVTQERDRIMRDLHDDLGSKLLSLVHLSKGDAEQLARSAMQDMCDVLAALEAAPCTLEDASEEWRLEAEERAEMLGRELRWHTEGSQDVELNARQRTNLGRIMREGITNAFRHGDAGPVAVQVVAKNDGLTLSVAVTTTAGNGPESWHEGRGLRAVRQRAADLGGSANWIARDGKVEMQVDVPLTTPVAQPAFG